MRWQQFHKIFQEMIDEGFLIEHKIYSNDGNNEYLETHYKVNHGKYSSDMLE